MRAETVEAVEIDVHFPKDALLRHFAKIPVRLLAALFDKGKHVRVGDPRGTAATLRKGKNVALRDGKICIVEVFHEAIIEEGDVRGIGQGVAVAAL